MEHPPDKPEAAPCAPQGVTAEEAKFLLTVFARLKEKRFGRLEVTVKDGRVISVELVEKLDRKLFRWFRS